MGCDEHRSITWRESRGKHAAKKQLCGPAVELVRRDIEPMLKWLTEYAPKTQTCLAIALSKVENLLAVHLFSARLTNLYPHRHTRSVNMEHTNQVGRWVHGGANPLQAYLAMIKTSVAPIVCSRMGTTPRHLLIADMIVVYILPQGQRINTHNRGFFRTKVTHGKLLILIQAKAWCSSGDLTKNDQDRAIKGAICVSVQKVVEIIT